MSNFKKQADRRGRPQGGKNADTELKKNISQFLYRACVLATPLASLSEIEQIIDLPNIFEGAGRRLTRMVSTKDNRPLSLSEAQKTAQRLQELGWLPKGPQEKDMENYSEWDARIKSNLIAIGDDIFQDRVIELRSAELARLKLMAAVMEYQKIIKELEFGEVISSPPPNDEFADCPEFSLFDTDLALWQLDRTKYEFKGQVPRNPFQIPLKDQSNSIDLSDPQFWEKLNKLFD